MAELNNDLKILTNEQLAEKVQKGSENDFSELVLRLNNKLFSFLITRTSSYEDAEDLVQETFVKAYKNIEKYDDRWKFTTWIFTIAVRLANTHYRRKKPVYSLEDRNDFKHKGYRPDNILEQKQQWQNIWTLADKKLSKSQYQSLWLKYAEDMSVKEIAQILGKSKVNVKVMLFRARNNMAKVLANENQKG